jgi:hypothetical protein
LTALFWLRRYAPGICISLITLTGCGGSQMPTNPLTPSQSDAPITREHGRTPWMAPDAKGQNLLYIANHPATAYRDESIYVYSYPGLKLEGELAGAFTGNYGLCSDANGDVFVPAGSTIFEYAHGGTQPIAELSDPYGGAGYCAIDPTTGNLAVSPTVAVYAGARGTGKEYPGGNAVGNNSCAYDNKGNLFVNGWSYDGSLGPAYAQMGLVELRKGASRLRTINFPVLTDSAAILCDGKYLVVGDAGVIGRYRVIRKTAKIVDFIGLRGADYMGQFWMQGSTLIVPSYWENNSIPHAHVFFYDYPKGGRPTKTMNGLSAPYGATVSLAAKERTK